MNKQSYLSQLKSELRGLNYDEITEIIADINEHFEMSTLDGRTEQAVIEKLGPAKALALAYRVNSNSMPPTSLTQILSNLKTLFKLSSIGLFALPLAIAVSAIILSFYLVILCLLFASLLVSLTPFLEMVIPQYIHTAGLSPELLSGIGLVSGFLLYKALKSYHLITRRLYKAVLQYSKYHFIVKN